MKDMGKELNHGLETVKDFIEIIAMDFDYGEFADQNTPALISAVESCKALIRDVCTCILEQGDINDEQRRLLGNMVSIMLSDKDFEDDEDEDDDALAEELYKTACDITDEDIEKFAKDAGLSKKETAYLKKSIKETVDMKGELDDPDEEDIEMVTAILNKALYL